MPVNIAGNRADPAMSDDSPISDAPDEIRAASPPLEPPGVRVRSYGLRVWPDTLLYVSQHMHNSGVLLTNRMMPPCFFTNSTHGASYWATRFSLNTRPPWLIIPFTAMLSLTVTGSPSNGVLRSISSTVRVPLAISRSIWRASFNASSKRSSTIAFTSGFTSLHRSIYAWTTSSLVTCPF